MSIARAQATQDAPPRPLSSAASSQAAFDAGLPADDFKAFFRHHPGGVSLITAVGDAGPVALTATSLASISAEPPLVVFSVSDLSSSAPVLREADTVVVHLLGSEDLELAKLGATSGIDRFADTSIWAPLETGEPTFHGTRWLRCRVVNRFPTGTSTLIVGQALESSDAADTDRQGLVYVDRTWHRLGEHSRAHA
ncbi:flavin reductase family protein [Microbacterium marinilacus]|uniref:Flavin reductase family protein n=1 Tax=Microbacterium marinilacus TaxID=415209 RepID=A0ABP7BU05_9MICO|nr:flavin reductase family protein [Microbacterium marinilacus]MBY0689196.1 flavin reductase family protein [Microbacterium marinilacus]